MEVSFSDIGKLIHIYEKRFDYVASRSTRDVFKEAQRPRSVGGNMPVESGRLRESLTVEGRAGRMKGATSYVAIAAAMRAGDVVTGGWSTGYERLAEYGGNGRPGNQFRDIAAGKWRSIVQANAAEAVSSIW
ncbi:hypothetical protein GQE99_18650 [Maritimibacter sp. DP07]|uniref:Phage protein, HK97 gp10 family n=1 Tax=Maritimibacter harenae TaxID=2606218 RepID=A0A845MBD1_9RHOB|nr:hypothetical protein [Maritimibacter harenae]MZR15044.1 hypothetical protein [Maritimibacter harenae]